MLERTVFQQIMMEAVLQKLEDQIKSTNEMVLELRVLLERKDKQLQAVRILCRVPAACAVPCAVPCTSGVCCALCCDVCCAVLCAASFCSRV